MWYMVEATNAWGQELVFYAQAPSVDIIEKSYPALEIRFAQELRSELTELGVPWKSDYSSQAQSP